MTLTYGAFPANETTAEQNNGLTIVPTNLVQSQQTVEPFWNTGGLPGSTDLTDPVQTGLRACDYALDLPFATLDVSTTSYYVNFEIVPSEVDTVILKLLNLPTSGVYTITVQFATDSAFTDVATVATWTGKSDTVRLVQSGLDYPEDSATAGVNRFTAVRYVRVRFLQTAGTQGPPTIGEIVLGRRRVLSHAIETGSDEEPRGAAYEDFVTAGRKLYRYVTASGYEDPAASYRFGEVSAVGMNDLATLRTVQSESKNGAQAIWMRVRTSSNWILGYLRDPIHLPIGQGEYQDRVFNFELNEQPPFAATEV
jgi:hypothetical protein